MNRLTFKRHVRCFRDQLLIIIFITIVVIFFPIGSKIQSWFFAFLISVLPTLIIHLSYSIIDSGTAIRISQNKLIFQNKEVYREFDLTSSSNIECYLTNNLRYGNTPFLPWENYFYIKITDSNETIYLTSLLLDIKDLKAIANVNFHTDWFPIAFR
jgi:hypothetical protein